MLKLLQTCTPLEDTDLNPGDMFKGHGALALTAMLLSSFTIPAGAALLSQSQAEKQARGF